MHQKYNYHKSKYLAVSLKAESYPKVIDFI